MTFLPILPSVTVEPYIPALSNFVPKPDNTDQQTLGHTCNHLINGRAVITAAICVLAWYLDLQAHPFQGLKRQAVISGAKGQWLDRLSLICEKLFPCIPSLQDSPNHWFKAPNAKMELESLMQPAKRCCIVNQQAIIFVVLMLSALSK